MAHFELLPTRSRAWNGAALTSLLVHSLLVLPLVIGQVVATESTDPVEQLVVFLVPPDREIGRSEPGSRVEWTDHHGDGGETEEPLPPHPEPVQELAIGTAGDTAVAPPDAPPAEPVEETALTEVEVDSVVARDPTSAAPIYPAELLEKRVEGSTFVSYVVDTTGRVDTSTIEVMSSSHPAFSKSVRDALGLMKFRPAIQASRVVRQWVQQNFAFRIVRSAGLPPDTTPPRST